MANFENEWEPLFPSIMSDWASKSRNPRRHSSTKSLKSRLRAIKTYQPAPMAKWTILKNPFWTIKDSDNPKYIFENIATGICEDELERLSLRKLIYDQVNEL